MFPQAQAGKGVATEGVVGCHRAWQDSRGKGLGPQEGRGAMVGVASLWGQEA